MNDGNCAPEDCDCDGNAYHMCCLAVHFPSVIDNAAEKLEIENNIVLGQSARRRLYEYGHELPATFKANPAHGAASWRYTIPGHGGTNWGEICRILVAAGYAGAISIELEDADYRDSDQAQQQGLLDGASFLATC